MRLPRPLRLFVWCCVAACGGALSSCSPPVSANNTALVTVRAPSDFASKCVLVRAQRDGGPERLSRPQPFGSPDASVTIALVGATGEVASVNVQGYSDATCTTVVDETARGVAQVPGTLTLWLKRPDRDGGGSDDGGANDAGLDAGLDAGVDAGFDAGSDAGPVDAGADAGFPDAGTDAGVDAGRPDAGVDQDGDGSPFGVDCNDRDPQVRPGLTEVCFDRKDNNCDAGIDCADPQCGANAPCGAGDGTGAVCSSGSNRTCIETDCADGKDNDGDGGSAGADCQDSDCNMRPCNDRLDCTQAETCSQGACTPPALLRCGPTNDAGCLANCRNDAGTACVPTPLTASCTSNNRCLTNTSCQADGGCGGTAVTCTPQVCMDVRCDPDAGCVSTPHPRYRACTGGSCDGDGGCIPNGFLTPPSNVDESRLTFATIPGNPGIGGSCNAVLSTAGPKLSVVSSSSCTDQRFIAALDASVVVPQLTTGFEVMVVPLASTFKIENGASLRFVGPRPVVFVVRGDFDLDGTLSVESDGPDAGAGAGPCTVGVGRSMTDGGAPGSGGGAFGANGGWGSSDGVAFTPGGAAEGDPTLVPLRGGCAGGEVIENTTVTRPGQGGGALQISVSGTLSIDGPLNAGGGGGRRGVATNVPGSGGGSGGGILLEAATVDLRSNGSLTANGGGGGQGRFSAGNGFPQEGSNGGRTTSPASGGDDSDHEGDYGGNGGARNSAAGNGQDSDRSGSSIGGGGGGSVGRIRINATTCTNASSDVSPQPDSATSACRF